MSDSKAGPPRRATPPEGDGVLANLPRTRPQRSSPRRAAARARTAAKASPGAPAGARKRSEVRQPKPASASASAGKRARSTAKRPGASAPREDPSPRQGFECDGEALTGTVLPPGGPELLASAAELVGELAKSSLSSGERLLKDVFSRLRPS